MLMAYKVLKAQEGLKAQLELKGHKGNRAQRVL